MIELRYKCRPNLVPEDSVRPEARTLIVLNRRKGFVGIFSSLFKLNFKKGRKIESGKGSFVKCIV